ncbi:MAG: archease [Planctomycetota bacterium]|jgi:tRNA nucleotidyltransferase (CCA-adding enzyme)
MTGRAETFDHEADIGVAGEGATIGEAFAAGARAMFAITYDLAAVERQVEVRVRCTASDDELLFVRWLNTLLAEADLRGIVFGDFEVEVAHGRLSASAWGEPYDPARHGRGVEVKGATLTELKVARGLEGWRAQTVVDV